MLSSSLGRAPGRIDFLGGIAVSSGAAVLQMPLSRFTNVALTVLEEPVLELHSTAQPTVSVPLAVVAEWVASSHDLAWLRTALAAASLPAWTFHPLGCLALFLRGEGQPTPTGLRLEITSNVPVGLGLASSATLRIATLRALEALTERPLDAPARVRLAQQVAQEVAGTPDSLADGLTCASGESGQLVALLDNSEAVLTPLPLPADLIVAGWYSGVTPATTPAAVAQAAASMGRALLARRFSLAPAAIVDWTPSQIARWLPGVPERLLGADFLALGLSLGDAVAVDADTVYPVRAALRFGAEENQRVTLTMALWPALLAATEPTAARRALRVQLGEFLYQSHEGYGAMGLSTPETDAMVDALRELGPTRGIYGARISGHGAGGTVVVLLRHDAWEAIEGLTKRLGTPTLLR